MNEKIYIAFVGEKTLPNSTVNKLKYFNFNLTPFWVQTREVETASSLGQLWIVSRDDTLPIWESLIEVIEKKETISPLWCKLLSLIMGNKEEIPSFSPIHIKKPLIILQY